ncbi:hypothetical protein [uncultured Methanosphaera sp.]|uniref:hypothetical protein n=1 Tax=uncultured Methanosphaera sp. TaxID=262501 RepID=UPI00259188A8|nr:hypothetical protein [uncultured Methanosphaera sp.]
MVNPKKHKNNLNEDDLDRIYNNLNIAYKSSRDLKIKKNINQQILIFLLACRRLTSYELVRIPFKAIAKDTNDILNKHLEEQAKNNFCLIDDLLLTDNNYEPLNEEDIDHILSKIKINKLDKEITVTSLNMTKSRFNDYNHKNISRKKLNKYIELQEERTKMNKNISSILEEDNSSNKENENLNESHLQNLEEKINVIDYNLQKYNNGLTPIKQEIRKNTKLIDKIMDFQKSFEDEYYTDIKKLNDHLLNIQNEVNENNKNHSSDINSKDIEIIKDKLSALIENQEMIINNIEKNNLNNKKTTGNLIEEVYDKKDSNKEPYDKYFKKLDEEEIKYFLHGNKEINKINDNKSPYTNIIEYKILNEQELKSEVINWLSNNFKTSHYVKDYVEDVQIINKLRHYFHKNNKKFDELLLQNNLTEYISLWYNKHTKTNYNEELILEDEYGVKQYPKIKLSNIKQVLTTENTNNKFLSIITTWLKENTIKSKGYSSSNEEILDKIKILFEKEGWEFIRNYEEYIEVKDKNFKVINVRTFSQLIGKSLKKIYPFINDQTINVEKNRTSYPNIKIKEQTEKRTINKIKTELPDTQYNNNNIIYEWILNNIQFTNHLEDTIDINMVTKEIKDNLSLNISESTVKNIFLSSFNNFHSEFSKDELLIMDDFIIGYKFSMLNLPQRHIISSWINDYTDYSTNSDDKILMEVLMSKLNKELLKNNISVTTDLMYSNYPNDFKKYLITESSFNEIIYSVLKNKYSEIEIKDINDEKYIIGLKIYSNKTLTNKIIKKWINEHITIVKQPLILYENRIISELKTYLKENGIKIRTGFDLNNNLVKELKEYYFKNTNKELVIWNRTDEQGFESLDII